MVEGIEAIGGFVGGAGIGSAIKALAMSAKMRHQRSMARTTGTAQAADDSADKAVGRFGPNAVIVRRTLVFSLLIAVFFGPMIFAFMKEIPIVYAYRESAKGLFGLIGNVLGTGSETLKFREVFGYLLLEQYVTLLSTVFGTYVGQAIVKG